MSRCSRAVCDELPTWAENCPALEVEPNSLEVRFEEVAEPLRRVVAGLRAWIWILLTYWSVDGPLENCQRGVGVWARRRRIRPLPVGGCRQNPSLAHP